MTIAKGDTNMRLIRRAVALLLCIFMLITSLCSCALIELVPDFMLPDESDSYSEVQETVSVGIRDGEHYTVVSDNPIRVGKGESAKFKISLDAGFEFSSCLPGSTFEGGILTIPDVRYPTTASITLKRGSMVIEPGHDWVLNIMHDEYNHWYECRDEGCEEKLNFGAHSGGLATYTERAVCEACGVEYGELVPIPEFETIVLSAPEAEEGYHFLCWSLDIPLEEGGEVFEKEPKGTFQIPFGRNAVANYVDDGHHVIMYRLNGGTTEDGKDFYYQTFSNRHYQMPNTLHQRGIFKRSGYSLSRYTENPDGSGVYTTLGGKIEVNENGFVELYLQWELNTAIGIEYAVNKNEQDELVAYVIGYTGLNKNVVIPETVKRTYQGVPTEFKVEGVLAGAFADSDINTLHLPPSIRVIEDGMDDKGNKTALGAFEGCTSLTRVTIHDNVLSVSDEAFAGCTSLSTIYLNAARGPSYPGSEGMFALKYERLRLAAARGEKKIVVMSGSSSLYGFLAEEMGKAFPDYTVVNYGTNAGGNAFFYLDAFMRFFGEGDIIIHAPETTSTTQLGASALSRTTLRGTECMYELFSYVDMTRHSGFFDALCDFNVTWRYAEGKVMAERSYEEGSSFLNEYCDLKLNPDNPNYKAQSNASINAFALNRITEDRTSNMNLIYRDLVERGATMYYSFAPICKTAVSPAHLLEPTQTAYVEKMQSMIDYKIISNPADYILDENLFNNSDYHPGTTGARLRTQRLIEDLKRALDAQE